MQEYLSKMTEIVSQMKLYGEKIGQEKVVSNLRSLNSNWNNIVPTIMELKDLSTYSFDEFGSFCYLMRIG